MTNLRWACVALVAATACTDPAGIDSTERITINRITINRITINKLAAAALSSDALTDTDATASDTADALASTDDGRMVLSYLVGCALKPQQSIDVTVDGVTYTYAGSVGLAPMWEHTSLPPSTRDWVSACMISRINYFGVPVQLSLRGSAPNLVVSKDEAAAFQVQEGAFWGDIFDTDGDGQLELHACTGRDQLKDPTYGTLPLRVCAAPDSPCGFDIAGDCDDVCKPTTNGGYSSCAGNRAVLAVQLAGALP